MAWDDLAENEVPNFEEIEEAANSGKLIWSGGVGPAPMTYPPEFVFHRQDFEGELEHKDMSSSGIALTEVMTKGEMEQWAQIAPHIAPTIVSISSLTNYRIRCEIAPLAFPGYSYYVSWELWTADQTDIIDTYSAGPLGTTVRTFQSDASRQGQLVRFRARYFTPGPNFGDYSAWSGTAMISGGLGG